MCNTVCKYYTPKGLITWRKTNNEKTTAMATITHARAHDIHKSKHPHLLQYLKTKLCLKVLLEEFFIYRTVTAAIPCTICNYVLTCTT